MILEAPTVSADLSYYLTDGYNEEVLNFANSDLDVGFVSDRLRLPAAKTYTSSQRKKVKTPTLEWETLVQLEWVTLS